MPEVKKSKNEERKEKTRYALLEAAQVIFTRQGYHNTLISDIVTEANVGQGTFYRHFTDKRQIFSVLLDEFVKELMSEFNDMSTHMPSTYAEYRNASLVAIERIALKLEKNRELSLCLLSEAPSIDKKFAEEIEAIYERFSELAKYYLDHAINKGFVRKCNSKIISEALVGLGLRMIMTWWRDRYTELSIKELCEEVVNFAFLGMAGAPQ